MSSTVMRRMFGVSVLCFFTFYLLSPVITPFFLGTLLAYLANPVVSYLQTKHVPRTLGVIIVFLLVALGLFAVTLLLLPILQQQIVLAFQKIPELLQWLQQSLFPRFNYYLQTGDYFNLASIKAQLTDHVAKASNFAGVIATTAAHSTLAMLGWVMNVILVPVVAFYVLRDWPKIMKNLQQQLPVAYRYNIIILAQKCDQVVAAFFRGQLLVMLALALIYAIGLAVIGLQVAVFVGLMSGLFSIVPYLGFTLGVTVASIAMYLQTHNLTQIFYIWGLYGAGLLVENMVLTPLCVGNKVGLHPVVVMFVILAGGELFGFLGILLALPVAAVLLVMLKSIVSEKNDAIGA